METYGDGSPVKHYSYGLKENATVNGKPVSNLTELILELNKITDEEALGFNELCYRLEKGDLSALDDLKKLGIEVITYEDSARIIYNFEYKNHECSITVHKLDTEVGQFRNGLNELINKYQIGLISFKEICEYLERDGVEVKYLTDENGNLGISYTANKYGCAGYVNDEYYPNTNSAPYDTLRVCGLTNSQIQKYFHRAGDNKNTNVTFDNYVLNDNIRINGKSIKTIKALIEALKRPPIKPPIRPPRFTDNSFLLNNHLDYVNKQQQ